jgi:DMSO reductase anchor subunit
LAGADAISPEVWNASSLGRPEEVAGMVLGFVASALVPLAVMLLARVPSPQPVVTYCLVTIFMGVVSSTVIQFVERGDIPPLAWLGMVLPPVACYASLRPDSLDEVEVSTILGILVVEIFLSVAVIQWKWTKIHAAMQRAQRDELAP